MEKNIKEKISNCNLKNANGITLVALVVTIIVLLILAAVSLSAVFNQDGIFSRAENATDKYGQAKARETLELVLNEFQITKYEEGLSGENYENRLDSKIEEVGSLIPKEDENSKYQLVIVDGHIFEVDRSVPKIVDYKGPADGIIITAVLSNNTTDGWLSVSESNVNIKGKIMTYSGGKITTVSAKSGTTPISGFSIDKDGLYEINHIMDSSIITIEAEDSKGKKDSKEINVEVKIDGTKPIISNQTATANRMKITIKGNAADNESGLSSFTYSVSPTTVKDGKATGNLTSGVPIEIETTATGNYTVTFTARDNVGNTITATAGPVTTRDGITVAEAKQITAQNYPDYIGTKVIDYNPEAGGTWRVFYYDASGEFGDGSRTIYLKRDYVKMMELSSYTSHVPEDGGALMKQLNPTWAKSDNGKKATSAWLKNEHCASWLCDSTKWTTYKTADAKYAIGAAPIEMWCKAQNVYKNKYDTSASIIGCGIKNAYGYGYRINGGSLVDNQDTKVVNTSIPQSAVIATGKYQWLASPSSAGENCMGVMTNYTLYREPYFNSSGVCPVVSLKH